MQMMATVRVTPDETRILVSDEAGDRLLARLPALHTSHRWALRTLLEALALWSDRRLRVVCMRTNRATGTSSDWPMLSSSRPTVSIWISTSCLERAAAPAVPST